ncbi:hypothetical protein BU16DRAFT_614820 [Lophium mytilinum]|uniref:Actin-like ATPase domain-containing protein n=1 Tax=Lophium mytilinum TaxID=390894 RepID=A0A6A6R6N5_9PEZI|nr:hypothetical protein BU16DRAFT_614820 [Lophium mytilinum]
MSSLWLTTSTPFSVKAIAVFALLVVSSIGSRIASEIPLTYEPSEADCDVLPYSVGFDISLSYGTAVIRWANGSYEPVAKIDGTPDYVRNMDYMSLMSSRHLHTPYCDQIMGPLLDWRRMALRRFRKKLGLPASPEVGYIGRMIRQLRYATEQKLGHEIKHVVTTRPELRALYHEDMEDALEYVGLEYVEVCQGCPVQFELWSAYAGIGLGLCQNFTDVDECHKEMHPMPWLTVLSLFYSRKGLQVHAGRLSNSYDWSKCADLRWDTYTVDFDVGSDSIPATEPTAEVYWNKIRTQIRFVIQRQLPDPIDKVILQGESALNERFVREVYDLLRRDGSDDAVFYSDYPIFVAANGAAEHAYRSLSLCGPQKLSMSQRTYCKNR